MTTRISIAGLVAEATLAAGCSGSSPTQSKAGSPVVLRTGIYSAALEGGFVVRIDSIRPYPAGQPILQADYRAYVTVTFLTDA